MLGMYTSYICKSCNKEFILMSLEAQYTIRSGHYISCPHCGCRRIRESKETDSLKECMEARSYKRVHGALKQR